MSHTNHGRTGSGDSRTGGSPDPYADEERWETAELLALIDPTIGARMATEHPPRGWCWRCQRNAPCPTRFLAEATDRAARRHHLQARRTRHDDPRDPR